MPTTRQIDLSELGGETGGPQPLRGYPVRPSLDEHGPGPRPGVVVVSEIFGLVEQARRHTARLAAGDLALPWTCTARAAPAAACTGHLMENLAAQDAERDGEALRALADVADRRR